MSRDHFESSTMRLARASETLRRLDKCINDFFKKSPYRREVERVEERGVDRHKVVLTKPFPKRATSLAVEAIEGFRAVLDLATYGAACALGCGVSRYTSFVTAKSESDLEARLNGASKELPDAVKDVIRSYRPYPGGSQFIYPLNELCNSSKRRVIVPVGMAANSMRIGQMSVSGSCSILAPHWDKERRELVFGEFGFGSNFSYDISVNFQVVFDDVVSEVAGVPVVGFLKGVETEIRGVIRDIRGAVARGV